MSAVIRLEGAPLITGTKHVTECLRCNLCDQRYKTPLPDKIENASKHDVSVATVLAIGRYSMGLPLCRIEELQSMHGIPMPDATQWDLIRGLYDKVLPIYDTLLQHGANGELIIYDDTPNRILTSIAKKEATHTTAFIAENNKNKIHLYFTGKNQAGKNVENILQKRDTLTPVIAMMDASPSNIPKLSTDLMSRFILCFCLTHGRRKFFEIFDFFDKQCDVVLDIIGKVYTNDAHCKQLNMSPQKRLIYHKIHSKPLMKTLYCLLNNQLLYDQSEENSGLGQAVKYMLRHWRQLTTFLRVEGALLDSSWAERAIKIAIRHRRNSLFYKTPTGAKVGDCLMSLIYTAKQNNVNPYDYLNKLQQYADLVKDNPEQWLPWNYVHTLKTQTIDMAA